MNNRRPSQTLLFLLAALGKFTARRYGRLAAIGGFVLIGLLGWLDFALTARRIPLPVYYLVPILGLAWFVGWRAAAVATLLSGLINFWIDFSFARALSNPLFLQVSSAAVFVAALIAARGIATVRLMVEFYASAKVWRATLQPIRVGERLVLVFAQRYDAYAQDATARPTDIPVLLNPGAAFGTGSHPTTQMCLALLETYLRPGDRIFDLGCGTGILSIAAVKLGAASALAADITPEAERVTRENAVLNRVADQVEFRLGSLEVVLSPDAQNREFQHSPSDANLHPAPCAEPRGRKPAGANLPFDITIANLLASIIMDLLKAGLAQTLTRDGTLILSGIRAKETESVVHALQAAGLGLVETRRAEEWVAIAARFPRSE